MAPTFDEIAELYRRRREALAPVMSRRLALRDAYNGDISVPLPELEHNEQSTVVNLTSLGLDQTAMRIGSTLADVNYPPLRPGNETSIEWARKRRLANLGWWQANLMGLQLRRRARVLIGYAAAPVVIRPDTRRQIPCWEPRDALACYPGDTANPDDPCVPDAIFTFTRTRRWLEDYYGAILADQYFRWGNADKPNPDERFVCLEYHDAEVSVLGVLSNDPNQQGTDPWAGTTPPTGPERRGAELERIENRAGLCLAVVPGRITLDRPQGQFDGIIGKFQRQAMLEAMEYIAVKRGIFPDEWAVSPPGSPEPKVTVRADGIRGEMGVIKGGTIHTQQVNPGFMTNPTIDRLERNMRVEGGVPAEFGGESPTNVRTDRRGSTVMSATVDFVVQEAQALLAASLEAENRRAVGIVKGYWGSKSFSFYVAGKGANRRVDYVPSRHFETDDNRVRFPMAGSDANQLVVAGGQRVGMGTLSKRGFMELDPLVEDAELEHDRVVAEGLEAAQLQGLQQQAATGGIPPADLARITELVVTNEKNLFEAIKIVQEEAQARQPTTGAPGTAEAPVEPGSPGSQPGLAQPGQGAEAGVAVQPPPASVDNLTKLLRGLGAQRAAQNAAVA